MTRNKADNPILASLIPKVFKAKKIAEEFSVKLFEMYNGYKGIKQIKEKVLVNDSIQ